MAQQLINGKCYDWSSVDINVSGMDSIELQEISYDDEQELEVIYRKGGKSGLLKAKDTRVFISTSFRRSLSVMRMMELRLQRIYLPM